MHCAKKARECAGDEVRTQAASARHVQEVEGTRKLSDTCAQRPVSSPPRGSTGTVLQQDGGGKMQIKLRMSF